MRVSFFRSGYERTPTGTYYGANRWEDPVEMTAEEAIAEARRRFGGRPRFINGAIYLGDPTATLFTCNDARRIAEIRP